MYNNEELTCLLQFAARHTQGKDETYIREHVDELEMDFLCSLFQEVADALPTGLEGVSASQIFENANRTVDHVVKKVLSENTML